MKEDASEDQPVHGPRAAAKTSLAAVQEELDGPRSPTAAEESDFRGVLVTSFLRCFQHLCLRHQEPATCAGAG